MRETVYLEMNVAVHEMGFSLDELVVRVREALAEKGAPGIVAFVLRWIDETVCRLLVEGHTSWRPVACCAEPDYTYLDRRPRRFRTSLGKVEMNWRRVRCRHCGHTWIPLREFLGLERYQSASNELEKTVVEVVSEQSYRRGSAHLKTIGEIPVPRSTAHRWVAQSDCDELELPERGFAQLYVDGTGYKRRPTEEQTNEGDVRVVLGVSKTGAVHSVGAWSGVSWDEVGQSLKEKWGREEPLADLLISDGEPGLAEGLADLASDIQRCHWHTIRDLDNYLWQQKMPKEERRRLQGELAGILQIELPEEDFERIREGDKVQVHESAVAAEEEVGQMVSRLYRLGYTKAARYIQKAMKRLFSYVHVWLKTGLVSPRASSLVERMMREIGRRLKRMAFGWSEQGAAKMARIVIKRFTSANQWDAYWQKRLRIENRVIFSCGKIRLAKDLSPILGR